MLISNLRHFSNHRLNVFCSSLYTLFFFAHTRLCEPWFCFGASGAEMKTSWARLQTHSSVNRQRWGACFIWPSGRRLCLHQLGLWGEEEKKKKKEKRWEKRSMRGVTPAFFWLPHKEIQGTWLYWKSLLGSCKWKGSFAKIRLQKNIWCRRENCWYGGTVWSKSGRRGELGRMRHCSWSAEMSWV